jgi:pantoate--beta-alanine ligase
MSVAPRQPQPVTTVAELRAVLDHARQRGQRIGLVPTMGALHAGHLSLVEAAKAEGLFTVVSIYVNPTQFGPQEDLERYPRTLQADLEALSRCGTELVFAPTNAEMYPAAFDTWVEVGAASRPLEGQCRPGHFRGVATVVLKLLNQVQPDVAYFGQKDYQQALVIRRMVADLNVRVTIRVCPTVREPDGLAMSSRNRYLSPEERQQALVLWRSLCLAADAVAQGQRDAAALVAEMRALIAAVPSATIDYVALVDPESLEPVARITGTTLAVLAVRVGATRLIDNMLLEINSRSQNRAPHVEKGLQPRFLDKL